jgi:tetratricopeptide (TPR) repeat protein
MAYRKAIAQAVEDENPAGLKRMVEAALRLFPDDPAFQGLSKLVERRIPQSLYDRMVDRTLEEAKKLYGVQVVPAGSGEAPLAAPRARPGAGRYGAKAMACYFGGDLKGADEASLKAVELAGQSAEACAARAWLMKSMGRWTEAQAWAEQGLRKEPSNPDALALRGRCRWRAGLAEKAREDFRRAAEKDPAYGKLYALSRKASPSAVAERRLRAVRRAQAGDHAEAWMETDRLLAADSRDFNARDIRALISMRQGRWDSVLRESSLSLEIAPGNARALWNRGLALRALGRDREAEADFKEAVRRDPGYRKRENEIRPRRGFLAALMGAFRFP